MYIYKHIITMQQLYNNNAIKITNTTIEIKNNRSLTYK